MIVINPGMTEGIAQVLATGPEHLRPLFLAVRDRHCDLIMLSHGSGAFTTSGRPTILYVDDDMYSARGPAGFDVSLLKGFIKTAGAAAIVACEPLLIAYAGVAAMAGAGANAILIETRPEQESAWLELVQASNPGISLLLATVQPEVVH